MGHHDGSLAEFQKFRQHRIDHRRIQHHAVVNSRQLFDLERDGLVGVHEGAEFLSDLPVLHADGADLDDMVFHRGESRGLDVEHHEISSQALVLGIFHQLLHIVHQIALHAVDDLERIPLVQRVVSVGEGLDAAVVGDRDGRHPPGLGPLYDVFYLGHAVHIAHLRMAVELHPLDRAVIRTPALEILALFDARHGADGQFPVEAVDGGDALQLNKCPGLGGRLQIL